MNRYLIRALVAILTFCIGVAVSFRPRSSYRYARVYTYSGKSFETERCRKRFRYSQSPFVSIDMASTDPVRLSYSSTNPNSENLQMQTVEFQVDNAWDREIRAVSVGFSVSRPGSDYNSGSRTGWKLVDRELGTAEGTPATVSIQCGVDETLFVWVSSVEFKDGSRWLNPRHSS